MNAEMPQLGEARHLIWIWESNGVRRRMLGICDDREQAHKAVEDEITADNATFGSVEEAVIEWGMLLSYVLTGNGETANRRADGQVSWTAYLVRRS